MRCSASRSALRRRAAAAGGDLGGLALVLTDPPGWKGVGYGMIMLPIGIINFTIVVTHVGDCLGRYDVSSWGWAVPAQFGDNHVIHGWLKAGYIAARSSSECSC